MVILQESRDPLEVSVPPVAQQIVEAVEMMRQLLEETRFEHDGERIEVTVSAAIAPSQPDDDVDSLVERLSNTLTEAKRYGRNRTFVHEGKFPTPVVPPNLKIDAGVIQV